MKQLALFPKENLVGKVFAPQAGQRKAKRPLSTKNPIHLVLHSRKSDLKKRESLTLDHWNRFAKKFGIRTYRIAVCANHIHAIVRLHDFKNYFSFIRAFSGTLARSMGIKWKVRPATRLAAWGCDFKRLCQYVKLNILEAHGFLSYQTERTRRLPHFVRL